LSRTITGPSTDDNEPADIDPDKDQELLGSEPAIAANAETETETEADAEAEAETEAETETETGTGTEIGPSQEASDLGQSLIPGFEVEEAVPDEIIVQEASLVKSSAPRFPSRCSSRAKPVEQIELRFTVSAVGTVENPQILSSSNRCFNRAALQTVNKWRFNPRLENGRPTASPDKTAIVKFQR
jgi:TonB family protein